MEDNSTLILDEQFAEEPVFNPNVNLASAGKRLANGILDIVGYYILIFIVGIGMSIVLHEDFFISEENDPLLSFISFSIFILYYILFEYFFQKTPAKFLTRSKVVSIDGTKPGLGQCIGRTLCRFIPFEALSFFGHFPVGLHDRWPKTRVING